MGENRYLDKKVITNFREILNSSPIFYTEDKYKKNWNLICAMMDRIDSCVNYINDFDISNFKTEESLVNFLTYCSIINDAVVQLFKSIPSLNEFYETNIKEQSIYFKKDYERFIIQYDKNSINETYSDEKFFEFIRSLAFAHPLDTTRPKFLKKHDKLFSPYVLINSLFKDKIKNPVGIAIYSLLDDKIIYLWISADHIIDYISNRYCLLRKVSNWHTNEISGHESKWKMVKVNRELDNVSLLKHIKEILNERHCDSYFIDDALEMLECEVSNKNNCVLVEKYKKSLIKTFSHLSDWVDSLQEESLYPHEFFAMLDPAPKKMYSQAHYQLEKIFSYLKDDVVDLESYLKNRNVYISKGGTADLSNFEWGLLQSECFFDMFGKTYIDFDLSEIKSTSELKLLVRTALFMEVQKQNKGHISRCILKLIKEDEKRNINLKVTSKMKIKTSSNETINVLFVDTSKNAEGKTIIKE